MGRMGVRSEGVNVESRLAKQRTAQIGEANERSKPKLKVRPVQVGAEGQEKGQRPRAETPGSGSERYGFGTQERCSSASRQWGPTGAKGNQAGQGRPRKATWQEAEKKARRVPWKGEK